MVKRQNNELKAENMGVKVGKIKRVSKWTTGRVAAAINLSPASIRRYVRDFPEFFSPTAKQPRPGRRFVQADFEILQAIRALKFERAGNARIREKLAAGWRLTFDVSYTSQSMARLVESTLGAMEDAKEIYKKAEAAVKESTYHSKTAERNDSYFRQLCVVVWELQDDVKWILKALRSKGLYKPQGSPRPFKDPEGLHLYPKAEG
jgi:DNA-binding transcriptional MerR regulator